MNFDLSNPTTQAMLGGVIRSLLIAVGGLGLAGDQIAQLAGALAVLAGIGWSIWQKSRSAAAAHQTVVTAVKATAAAVDPQGAAPRVIAAAASTPQDPSAIVAAARSGNF